MIVQACINLVGGAPDCYTEGDPTDIANLVWRDAGITRPSDADIIAESTRLIAIETYSHTRMLAYPDKAEQLDQLYHDMAAGKLDTTGEWFKAIKAVKDAAPKS